MAMQAGMSLSRVLFLIGVGASTPILIKNGKISEILKDLQELLKSEGKSGDHVDDSDVLEMVRRLALEVRHASSSRQITVLNGSSNQSGNLSALVVPAATLGAVGYGYMWWKGLSFSDLMYVTKQNMENAVSSMKKSLEDVSASLAAAKKHLTQRIQNLDDKLEDQKEISKEIKSEVGVVRAGLSQIGDNLEYLQNSIYGLEGKMLELRKKQDMTCAGVQFLCESVGAMTGKMPEFLQGLPEPASGRGYYLEDKSLKGLLHLTNMIEEVSNEPKSSAITNVDMDSSKKPRALLRGGSIKI
ncbi:hypothetical protein QJS04_geneDACA006100 [Acorus gramineus]|uniref:DUF1664 domain-containing protein n=1 Tax=Acorus gramineus TaxID=55184 RepID=A0AAV9B1C4_ACOGR|nr:hypothetical protein QJS04_geneDACA006100 [Acorus gramineus]